MKLLYLFGQIVLPSFYHWNRWKLWENDWRIFGKAAPTIEALRTIIFLDVSEWIGEIILHTPTFRWIGLILDAFLIPALSFLGVHIARHISDQSKTSVYTKTWFQWILFGIGILLAAYNIRDTTMSPSEKIRQHVSYPQIRYYHDPWINSEGTRRILSLIMASFDFSIRLPLWLRISSMAISIAIIAGLAYAGATFEK